MSVWLNRCHFGDVRDVLRRMIADGVKVNTIVTSPPYWGLRSYLPAGHPDKTREIGSEPTLAEFLTTMVGVFDLCRQVLADDGTMWVNMGDSYAGSWGAQSRDHAGKHAGNESDISANQIKAAQIRESGTGSLTRTPGLKSKDLMGQPWRLAFALQDAGWWLRQDIIWHKPAPMPESVNDRCTKAHEYIFLLSKQERYYYDFEAMQEPVSASTHARLSQNVLAQKGSERAHAGAKTNGTMKAVGRGTNISQGVGRREGPPGNPAETPKAGLATSGNDGAYADGKSERMGRGAGWRKLAEAGSGTKNNDSMDEALAVMPTTRNRRSVWTVPSEPFSGAHFATFPRKLIEPCILAGAPVGGVVLDIFIGSGTTAQVAEALGRQFIGVELNKAYKPLQDERLAQTALILEAA